MKQISSRLNADEDEELPKGLRLDRQKLPSLLRSLSKYNLLFNFSYSHLGDSVANENLLKLLDQHIHSHLAQHGVCFETVSIGHETSPRSEALMEYENADWVILELGKLSRDSSSSVLKIAKITTWQLSLPGLGPLLDKTASIMGNPFAPTPKLLYFGKHCVLQVRITETAWTRQLLVSENSMVLLMTVVHCTRALLHVQWTRFSRTIEGKLVATHPVFLHAQQVSSPKHWSAALVLMMTTTTISWYVSANFPSVKFGPTAAPLTDR